MYDRVVKKDYESRLPGLGDVLKSADGKPVPANFSIVDGRPRWTTYAIYDSTKDGWVLKWSPKGGLAVFIHRECFNELDSYPFVDTLVVDRVLTRSVIAKSL
jgi:hypothetical protein